jgi:hypothetical protein
MKIRPVRSIRTERRTDMTKLRVPFVILRPRIKLKESLEIKTREQKTLKGGTELYVPDTMKMYLSVMQPSPGNQQ